MRAVILVFILAAPVLRAAEPGPVAALLQPYVDAHSMAGAVVLVANHERVLDLETIGFADIDKRKPMAPDTMFWIASMTKPMTATALMMLVDEGKISLDDPVEKFLPAFKDMQVKPAPPSTAPALEPAAHPITIREIMSHFAGLPFKSKIEVPTLDQRSLAERVDSYAHEPLQTQPGTRYSYANEGPNIAGRIIEVLSGESYEQFMQERLFTPLGMKDTTFRPDAEQIARTAVTYEATPDKRALQWTWVTSLAYPIDAPSRQPMPAGGLFSTAADVGTFGQMILNHGEWKGQRYLSEASWQAMRTRQNPTAQGNGVGFIWNLDKDSVAHDGAYRTHLRIDFTHDLVTVVLVQQNGKWPNGLGDINGQVDALARAKFGNPPGR
jgi:CubicO group peptidase (beta-lactamase class C family)